MAELQRRWGQDYRPGEPLDVDIAKVRSRPDLLRQVLTTSEPRKLGGQNAPMKLLRDGIKGAIRDALADVPQMIADALAEELEDYIEEDSFDLEPASQDEIDDMMGEF